MHRRLVVTVAAVAGLAAGFGACASRPLSPADHARERLEALAEQNRDARSFRVRWNPASCDCPPFEVLLGDSWRRAFLEPIADDGPVGLLRTQLLDGEARGTVPQARVTGTLSTGVRLAPNRLPCLVLKVTAVCDGLRCPNDEE